MWDEILFHPHTYARACCGSAGHPVSSQEMRQSFHITLDFITGVLKLLYGCQTSIITFHPKTVSSKDSQLALTVLLGRLYKGNVENPKTGSVPLTLKFLWDACVESKQDTDCKRSKDPVSAGISLCATCNDLGVSVPECTSSNPVVWWCPRREGNLASHFP